MLIMLCLFSIDEFLRILNLDLDVNVDDVIYVNYN